MNIKELMTYRSMDQSYILQQFTYSRIQHVQLVCIVMHELFDCLSYAYGFVNFGGLAMFYPHVFQI